MSGTTTRCVHAFVSGRVQGVYFRAFTREQALAHRVSGWARNLPDGRVEVLLEGEAKAVDSVLSAIARGPAQAEVTGITQEEYPLQQCHGFAIG